MEHDIKLVMGCCTVKWDKTLTGNSLNKFHGTHSHSLILPQGDTYMYRKKAKQKRKLDVNLVMYSFKVGKYLLCFKYKPMWKWQSFL